MLRPNLKICCQKINKTKLSLYIDVSEDLAHLFVWEKVLLVFWILQVVVLKVFPQHLDTLCSGGFFHSNDGGKIVRDLHWLG